MRARTCLAQVLTRYIERCPGTNALVQAMFVCRVQAMLVGVCLAQALTRYIVPCPSTTVALSAQCDCIFVLSCTCIVVCCLPCACIDCERPIRHSCTNQPQQHGTITAFEVGVASRASCARLSWNAQVMQDALLGALQASMVIAHVASGPKPYA